MHLRGLLDIVFPPICLHCRGEIKSGGVLCAACASGIKLNQTLFCGECGSRLAAGKKICHKDFPYLLGSAANYDSEVVRNLIHNLKFKSVKDAAGPLAKFLIQYAERLELDVKNFTIVPIPLSAARLRERGFNQSELIAKIFAEHFQIPLETKILVRAKNTKPQSETKSLAERRENIRGCFIVRYPEYVRGKNIFLIDDVTTSGATFLEAALALKSAGAKKVIALAAAKA